jgi:hypothetical protein
MRRLFKLSRTAAPCAVINDIVSPSAVCAQRTHVSDLSNIAILLPPTTKEEEDARNEGQTAVTGEPEVAG